MSKIISFSLSENASLELKAVQKRLGFSGRSEMVRTAISALVKENESLSKLKGTVSVVLIITHTHESNVVGIIHKYEEVVVTHIHQHINERCVEIFMLKGRAELIKEIFNAASKTKGVFEAKLVTI